MGSDAAAATLAGGDGGRRQWKWAEQMCITFQRKENLNGQSVGMSRNKTTGRIDNVIKGLIKESLEQRPFRNYTLEFIPIFLKLVCNHQGSWLTW